MPENNDDYSFSWAGYGLPTDLKVAIGDITGNKRNNIVTLNKNGYLAAYEWTGKYIFPITKIYFGRKLRGMVLADVNGDGIKEIVLMGPNILLVYSFANNKWHQLAKHILSGKITDMAKGDFDKDHMDEIVIAIAGYEILVFKVVEGKFNVLLRSNLTHYTSIAAGDVDGDGTDELVFLQAGTSLGLDKVIVSRLLGRSFRQMAVKNIPYKATGFVKVLPGDSDNHQIILGVNKNYRIVVFAYSKGEIVNKWLSNILGNIRDVFLADVDNDGSFELMIAVEKKIYVYHQTGIVFLRSKAIDLSRYVAAVIAGDVYQKGTDVIVAITVTGDIIIIWNGVKARSQFLVTQDTSLPENYPEILKIIETQVEDIKIQKKKVMRNKIILEGKIDIVILYVAEPDRSVRAFNVLIPFFHVVQITGILPESRILTDIRVEYAKAHINSEVTGGLEIIVIAEVIVYDITINYEQSLREVAALYGVNESELADINDLETDTILKKGTKLKIPKR